MINTACHRCESIICLTRFRQSVRCFNCKTIVVSRRVTKQVLSHWRHKTHATFDIIWQSRLMTRSKAYRWLANTLGLKRKACHIGKFDVAACKTVIKICEKAMSQDAIQSVAVAKIVSLVKHNGILSRATLSNMLHAHGLPTGAAINAAIAKHRVSKHIINSIECFTITEWGDETDRQPKAPRL